MKYIFLFITIFYLSGCKDPSNTYDIVVSNVNLIDGTGTPMKKAVTIGIKDGKIAVVDSISKIKFLKKIDGTGKFMIPGLFDCHAHTNDFNRDFPRFIHYGVTSILVPGGSTCTNEYYSAMRERGEQDTVPAPYVFHTSQHFTMEGRHPSKTYTNSNWRDGETIHYLRDTLQIERLVQQVVQYPIAGIKLTIEDGPGPPFVERMPQHFIDKTVKEASKHGLEVFAHVSDNIELEMAINAGVQNFLHYTGVKLNLQDTDQLHLINKIKEGDPFWVTTLMIDKSFLYPLHPEWFKAEDMLPEYQQFVNELTPKFIERSNMYLKALQEEYGLGGTSLSSFISPQAEDIQFLHEMGINMVLGTDTGNDFNFPGYSLHEEMQLLEMGGISPLDIIKMGTLNAAKMMGVEDQFGSIEVGKVANMVLLDKNPLESIANTLTVNTVIKNGLVQERIIK
ncbi:imidazolonepropionase-like amidohydrolase [Saonia flava]|uniref:Imidazolonepropionase-like amidohydrolase n=1 Tax=Saonia flava TaxID=523696 RepID=A0A846QXH3_9FLAO|nr:amidohydrolase family protein [Saonia flava]NJB69804.1 imidazolonepropionase-like amidohydrolase [Saonia flava]